MRITSKSRIAISTKSTSNSHWLMVTTHPLYIVSTITSSTTGVVILKLRSKAPAIRGKLSPNVGEKNEFVEPGSIRTLAFWPQIIKILATIVGAASKSCWIMTNTLPWVWPPEFCTGWAVLGLIYLKTWLSRLCWVNCLCGSWVGGW